MRYKIICDATDCTCTFWVSGSTECSETGAVDLNENDDAWTEYACEHIKAGGSYTIGEGESDEPDYDPDAPYYED